MHIAHLPLKIFLKQTQNGVVVYVHLAHVPLVKIILQTNTKWRRLRAYCTCATEDYSKNKNKMASPCALYLDEEGELAVGAGEGGRVVLCYVQGERFLRRVQRVLADLQIRISR